MGIQRQFDRHGHYLDPETEASSKQKTRRFSLDRFNETLPPGMTLHPTKGFRTRSLKSQRASVATADMRRGMVPPMILIYRQVANFLRSGIYKGSNANDK